MPFKLADLRRGYVVFAHDVVMAGASFVLALYLRLGDSMTTFTAGWLVEATALFTLVCVVAFWSMGLYRGVWRYASMNDLLAITRSATVAVLLFLVVMFVWTRLEPIPRSIPFITWLVLMAALGGPRFLYRMIKDRHFSLRLAADLHPRIPILLVGAGDGAELFVRALRQTENANYRVVGILSRSTNRVGRRIHGVEVLGTLDQVSQVVKRLQVNGDAPQRLVLTREDLPGAEVRALLEAADDLGLALARVPRPTDLRAGPVDRAEIKPIDLEDLLGRPQTALDRQAMKELLGGRRVLITGAGGSIGGEMVRQVSDLEPLEMILLDSSEYALYRIDMELSRRHPALVRHALIADIRDRARLERIFADHRPELVFHAAALKHVPLVEDNPLEGVLTNVVGTANVAELCRQHQVATMVQISTDKAVNPSSIMGVTKRIAESYCQALDLERALDDTTCYVTVRFGNVLGSTGSVVPLFQQQLAAGGPITVTHPDMKRYFMTIREAVELVLEASVLGGRGHQREGKIFVLDMGEPVRIVDLARQMIRLAGLKPDEDVAIEFIGVRPGEKLFEEVFHGGESLVETEYKGILLAAPRAVDAAGLRGAITALDAACRLGDRERVMEVVRALVPEYRHRKSAEEGI